MEAKKTNAAAERSGSAMNDELADGKKPSAVIGGTMEDGSEEDDGDGSESSAGGGEQFEDEAESEDEGNVDEVLYGGTPAKATSPSFDNAARTESNDSAASDLRVIDAADAKVIEDNVIDAKVESFTMQTPVKVKPKEQGGGIQVDSKSIESAEPVIEAEVLLGDEPKVVKKKSKSKKKSKDGKERRRKSKDSGSESKGQLSDLPSELGGKGAIGGGVLGGLKPLAPIPLKPIAALQEEMKNRKMQAEEAFRKNREMLYEQKRKQEELQKQARLTEDDMIRRAAHLKKQRDLIVAKKKAEREAAARDARDAEAEKAEEFKRKIANFSTGPAIAKEKGSSSNDNAGQDAARREEAKDKDDADERRANMRIALAANMKRNMLMAEEERLNKIQSDQFAELDEKLRKVEELREENRQREDELRAAIRHNQNIRAINIQRHSVAGESEDD